MKKTIFGASVLALGILMTGSCTPALHASADVLAPMGAVMPINLDQEIKDIQHQVLMISGRYFGRLTATQKTALTTLEIRIHNLLNTPGITAGQVAALNDELESVEEMLGKR